jgi:signal transduction histidine kinase
MRLVWQLVCFAMLFAVMSVSWAENVCTSAEPVTQVQRLLVDAHSVQPENKIASTVAVPDGLAPALRTERISISYTMDVSACANTDSASLWLFRVGAPYTVSYQGKPLGLLSAWHAELQVEGAHNGRIPALFSLPPGATSVTVRLLTLPYIATGIVQAAIGPTNSLLPLQAKSLDASVGYADTASGVLLVLSLLTALLWFRRRNDRGLIWLALACLLWSIRGLAYFGHPIYFSPVIFELFNSLSVLLASAAFSTSVLYLLGGAKRFEKWAFLVVAGVGVVGITLAVLSGTGAATARAFCLLASFGYAAWLFRRIWGVRKTALPSTVVTLAVGLLALTGCALHDITVVLGIRGPQSPSYLFWGFVVLLVGLAAMSAQYVAMTLNRAEHSNEELERRVTKAASDLQDSYAKLSTSQQEAARTQERTRLLRDMHDGLGAQLMTALRGVERGALTTPQITLSLQDSLDELRLLIDSADIGPYLHQALAGWRSRWEGRLAAAGITIEWHIDDALDNVILPNETVLQAVRILQEAATNVVKHSRATRLVLRTRWLPASAADMSTQVQITVTDDGSGLSAASASNRSRGLQNMAFRATSIGAQLVVTSLTPPAKGCQVLLSIPLANAALKSITPG